MKLILLLIFCAKHGAHSLAYPDINARQILSNAQIAIHTKNDSALPDLFTQEIVELISDKFYNTRPLIIPVYDVFDVQSINDSNFPIVTFEAKVGNLISTFTAVYSEDYKKYLLSQKDIFEFMVNKDALEELIKIQAKEDAFHLLMDVREAIRTKKKDMFIYDLLTPTARFITCNRKSKTSNTMFDKIQKIPTPFIPVISTRNIEVTSVDVSGNRMIFYAKIGDKDVQYMARYSMYYSRWYLGQENCADYYPALINQTALGPEIAYQTVGLFSFALKLLSPRRYGEIVASVLTLIKCAEVSEEEFEGLSFFNHYFDLKQYYVIDYMNPSFKVSDVVFNVTSGSLKFVVELNNLVTNEIQVERSDGEYRMVSIKNLKCLDYSVPNSNTKKEEKQYLQFMELAEDLVARYVKVRQTSNIDERLKLFSNPYTLSNGDKISHEDMESYSFSDDVQDLYVIDVHYNTLGLQSFRAKALFKKEGLQFMVYYISFGDPRLVLERKFMLE